MQRAQPGKYQLCGLVLFLIFRLDLIFLVFLNSTLDTPNFYDSKIIFSTTNYHVFRSGVIANKLGINCEGMGSKTKWYFHTNALIREFVANLYQERKKHFLIILIIMIMLYILIAIGYKYNLL